MEQAVTGIILERDLVVQEPQVVRSLSGPSQIQFKVLDDEQSAQGMDFRAHGYYIHAEIDRQDGTSWLFASGITQPTETDAASGSLTVTAKGYSGYLEGMPWLDNYNPIAVDPFHVIHRIWNSAQSFGNGNIGVVVEPADSGTLLLPGFYFDGSEFVLDFFAYFVRASDYRDSMEEMNSLAKDIPIDYLEMPEWNAGRTAVTKKLRLDYPRRGVQQSGIVFRLGENVLQADPVAESDIDWVSDIIVRGWWPGKMHSSTLSNADPLRFRKVMKEEDALLNSRERAEAQAGRRLSRRQVPRHWGSITVDMYHPSAAWGTYDVGDDILVCGNMPFVGKVEQWHRILSIQPDDSVGQVAMTLRHVDAFNYDPIEFTG